MRPSTSLIRRFRVGWPRALKLPLRPYREAELLPVCRIRLRQCVSPEAELLFPRRFKAEASKLGKGCSRVLTEQQYCIVWDHPDLARKPPESEVL